jgi:hypothetical protein
MSDDNKINPVTLDMSLDDVEDLPGFVVPLSGVYHVVLDNGIEQKEINEHPALQVEMKIVEAAEISETPNDGETIPKAGDVFTLAWLLDNKFGVGTLKQFLVPLGEHLGTRQIGAIVEQSKGLNLMVVVKRVYNKDKDRHYPQLKKVVVV